MMASATALTRASRALMRRTTTIHRLFPAMTRPFTLTHSRALFFSSIAGIRQAIADGEQEPVQVTDRSLIAPWFHELDDMPEERMCIVAPSTAPPAFPAMPVGDRDHHSHTITQPKYAVTPTPTSSGKRWIHSSTTLYSPPDHPAPPATPYASDDPTQPGFDRNKQIRSQAAWQETQQAGIACPLTPPVEPADTDKQKPVADASNPTNAYGKLHPDDTGGRGHIGLGEHEYMAPAATRPTGNWDDTDSAAKETKIHVPDTLPEADAADEQVLPQKPEDFVGACVAWHPVASMLFGASPAAATTRVQYHYDVARGYATNAKPQVMPKVSEIVNPAGEGGAKPRIRQSMQETVRVKSAVNPVKTRTYTGVEDGGQQQQVGADEAEEYQDGAIRNPHKELSGN